MSEELKKGDKVLFNPENGYVWDAEIDGASFEQCYGVVEGCSGSRYMFKVVHIPTGRMDVLNHNPNETWPFYDHDFRKTTDEEIEAIRRELTASAQEAVASSGTPAAPSHRQYNIGNSDYSKHKIQPWDVWLEYQLNPWEADIVKRILRKKEGQSYREDLEKIKHICDELISQIDRRIHYGRRGE